MRPSLLLSTMPVAARKPRPAALWRSWASCTSQPLALRCHVRKYCTSCMYCSHFSLSVPIWQCTCVRTWPTSLRFFALSSRTIPRVTRNSSLSSRAPLHWRSRRLWSWVSSLTSSLRSSSRSSKSCSSCRRSASVSMQTSILPTRYLLSSAMSPATFFSLSSISALLLFQVSSSSICLASVLSWSWVSSKAFSPISRISWMFMALIFSWMFRHCLASSMRCRSRPSSAGTTSSVILLSTLAIKPFSISTLASSLESALFSISFSLASSSFILLSCTTDCPSTPRRRG
mmetsp:Transcript_72335/g.192165  ORF Transcript_72335/g.192165 Transcript_72335/m.192165 type:complete len:287 (+) Transcript_72335:761-1621(+)